MYKIVETTKGPVKGVLKKSAVGENFYRFRGIPYAKPPVGDLRFKDPQPIDAWTVPVDATNQGPTAIALNYFTNKLNEGCKEDCLTLNVYTKSINPGKPLPVMVWIHGGAFKFGDANENFYGPDYLLQKNVVFVSINYRLGALGFLSIPDPSINVPGNAGLKDQTMALRWVRENIHAFGGDNKNVTVFGESAGACSVHWHMLSDFSKGLFDKAIVQSGSAFSEMSNSSQRNWAERLAKHLGWNGEGGTIGYYEFLKNVDAIQMIKQQENIMTGAEVKRWIVTPFAPTIEPYVAEQSFYTKHPLEMNETAWGNAVPLIIGSNSEEGLVWYHDLVKNPSLYNRDDGFRNLLKYKLGEDSEKIELHADRLKRFYYGDEQPSVKNLSKFMSILTDYMFAYGIYVAVTARVRDPKTAPTYLYRFNFESKSNFTISKRLFSSADLPGVCHAEEMEYLFRNTFVKPALSNSSEHKTIQRMVTAWTQFAITGNPNADVLTVSWEPVAAPEPYYCLNISKNVTFVTYPETDRCALWNSFV